MTNAEFYRHEIRGEYGIFCEEFIAPKVLKPAKIDCDAIKCAQCAMIQMAWLVEEHKEPSIDWENVPIDTPILVRDSDDGEWLKRHFAGVGTNSETITAWSNGNTSFTENTRNPWIHAKLWEGSEEQAAEQEAAE